MTVAKRIEVDELARLREAGPVTILDLRRDWDESDESIPGATRVDPEHFQEYVDELEQGHSVVTYCT